MKTIPTAKGSFNPLLNIYSAFRPLNFVDNYTKKYGNFYRFKLSNNRPIIVVINPQAIEEIFTAPADTFESAEANKVLSFLLGDNSLLLLDGKAHRNRRRLLMPPFHGELLQKCSDKIVEITNNVYNRLKTNQPFAVRSYMQEITLRVILDVVFGIDRGTRSERLRELLVELLETFNTPFKSLLIIFPLLQKDWGKFSPWGRFLRLKAEIRELIYQEIRQRRKLLASESHQDILSLLLLAKDEKGEGMTDEELHDELITLLFAGHETTASALSWVFYWIHYVPEVQTKLRSELGSLGEADYKKINNLPYLNAVISETLRIYPVASSAFARIPTQPISILGHQLNRDDWLSI